VALWDLSGICCGAPAAGWMRSLVLGRVLVSSTKLCLVASS